MVTVKFRRISGRRVLCMTENIQQAPVKDPITVEDLDRIDIRVGTILKVEDLPRSKKVSVLTVDFGDHQRTILASLREERENPAEIEGKQTLFVLNLPPRKISGVTSEGMLFDIGYADGIKPALATPERPVPNGTRLG
jgi:tRNA-binding protein